MLNEVDSSTGPPLAPRCRFQYSLSTLMLVTHDATLAARCARRIFLQAGRIVGGDA